jgi:hypothetical protein
MTDTTTTSVHLRIEGTEHVFDIANLNYAEGEAIERASGGTITAFGLALSAGSITAQKILVWTIMHRSNTDLRLADLDTMPVSAVEFVSDEAHEPTAAAEPGPTEAPGAEEAPASPSGA